MRKERPKRGPKAFLPAERQEIVGKLLERIAEGEELKAVCGKEGFPTFATIYRWFADDPTFELAYRRARSGYAAAQAFKATVLANKLAAMEIPQGHVRGIEVAINHFRWLAERADPLTWAQQQPKAPAMAIQIVTNALEGEIAPQTITIEAPK